MSDHAVLYTHVQDKILGARSPATTEFLLGDGTSVVLRYTILWYVTLRIALGFTDTGSCGSRMLCLLLFRAPAAPLNVVVKGSLTTLRTLVDGTGEECSFGERH